MSDCNFEYQKLIAEILKYGDFITTRNADTLSLVDYPAIIFDKTPLVTVRKTAWKKALREMEWFMSGDPWCPDELLDWWNGQLSGQCYRGGYSQQFRYSGYDQRNPFDQVKYVIDGLRNNPNSRRLILTTWNPHDMAHITELNQNPQTPSCCHGTIVQFFVRDNKLSMTTYQRSCDVLLGLVHNWISYWALMLYFAHHANLKIGTLRYIFGDAHLYQDSSHIAVAKAITMCNLLEREPLQEPRLIYTGSSEFKASDFEMIGDILDPVTTIRPKLF